MGICHSYTPDGRCVSLLKILLTNFCIYDCLYCVNRVSSNVPRARFTRRRGRQLTLDFYRRNYIEGLFLSSGIIRSPDYTMEQLVEVARTLREEHDFRGYIHLKTDPRRERRAARARPAATPTASASTSSCRPSDEPRRARAGEGRGRDPRARWRAHARRASTTAKAERAKRRRAARSRRPGQSTQMIVGADARRRRDDPRDQRARSTAATGCGASTTRPSARSRDAERGAAAEAAAAACASTGSTRPTG